LAATWNGNLKLFRLFDKKIIIIAYVIVFNGWWWIQQDIQIKNEEGK